MVDEGPPTIAEDPPQDLGAWYRKSSMPGNLSTDAVRSPPRAPANRSENALSLYLHGASSEETISNKCVSAIPVAGNISRGSEQVFHTVHSTAADTLHHDPIYALQLHGNNIDPTWLRSATGTGDFSRDAQPCYYVTVFDSDFSIKIKIWHYKKCYTNIWPIVNLSTWNR